MMGAKFNYIKGNLLDSKDFFILHGCNAYGVMGSGVAKAIKEKWPNVYTQYSDAFEYILEKYNSNTLMFGKCQFVNVDNGAHCVVNMITQNNYGKDGKRYVKYDFVYDAFFELKQSIKTQMEVSMPFIGCGLGGGNWSIIKVIIEEIFNDTNITFNVYYLNEEEYKNIVGE